jgi:MFS transporter, PAT family, beta-lactamase induction signal transducer AmpG
LLRAALVFNRVDHDSGDAAASWSDSPRPGSTGLLNAVVFISQVASTLVMLPLGGLMAHTVSDDMKGRAAGWYQAGNLGGNGIGGGAGVWLAAHYSKEVAAWSISFSMFACALALFFVSDVRLVATETFVQRMRFLGQDLLAIVRSALPLFITVLVCSPIGAGGMSNLWAAVAPDWHADADTVALVDGVLNGIISAVGCVVGGWVADRIGIWWAYFGSGVAIAIVAMVMAIASRTPGIFSSGVLVYAFSQGLAYATFSAIVLVAIGRGTASTKYAALSVAWKPSCRLHDSARRLGARQIWNIVDASLRCVIRHCLHHRRNVRPEKNKSDPQRIP